MIAAAATCHAEVSCFRTPAQAAVQVGEQQGGGYRLEFVRQDAFGSRNWATVRSCAHPEWPAVVVRSAASVTAPAVNVSAAAQVAPPIVVGGSRVRVVLADAMARVEMSGVAQASGRVGDRIAVRILAPGGDNEGRLAFALVRSADVLEISQ
jgi:hypothetical protein